MALIIPGFKTGESREIRQKSVIYWSRHFYDRDVAEHKAFLEFIEKLKKSPDSFRVTKAQAERKKKFLSKDIVNKETGEVYDSRKLLGMIDDKKLEEFTELMGYYQIRTSEIDMDAREVIDKYHGLSRIENQFEELKGPSDPEGTAKMESDSHEGRKLLVRGYR